MFVIVHNDRVIWGPKQWNKRGFQEVIMEDCEVECSLPTRNDEAKPIRVNDDIVILRVVSLDSPVPKQYLQRHDGPFWNFYEDRAEMYYTVVDFPVDIAKSFMIDAVSANRKAAEIGSVKIIIGNSLVTVSADRDARHVYTTNILTMNDDDKISWKFPETWLDLKKSDLTNIISEINKHVNNCFIWEKEKIDEINAANTLEELEVIKLEYKVE